MAKVAKPVRVRLCGWSRWHQGRADTALWVKADNHEWEVGYDYIIARADKYTLTPKRPKPTGGRGGGGKGRKAK